MRKALALLAIGLAILLLGIFLRRLVSTRVIGYARSQDGTELCVVQKLGDLLDTSVYYRKPGSNWGWFYYDHEDTYWAKATIIVDELNHRMTLMRGKEAVADFDWRSEVFHRQATGERHKGAMHWMRPGFSPTNGIE
jgi:hypothetical protein